MRWDFDEKQLEVALQTNLGAQVANKVMDKVEAEVVGTAIKEFLFSDEARILRKADAGIIVPGGSRGAR